MECEGRIALLIRPSLPPSPRVSIPGARQSAIERSMVYVYMFALYDFALYSVGRWPCVSACVIGVVVGCFGGPIRCLPAMRAAIRAGREGQMIAAFLRQIVLRRMPVRWLQFAVININFTVNRKQYRRLTSGVVSSWGVRRGNSDGRKDVVFCRRWRNDTGANKQAERSLCIFYWFGRLGQMIQTANN